MHIHTTTYDRRRPRRGFGRTFLQIVMYLLSLIPMCIVAWKIDLWGPDRLFPERLAAKAIEAPAEQTPPVKRRGVRLPVSGKTAERRPVRMPQVEPRESQPVTQEAPDSEAEPDPAKPFPAELATAEVALDLSRDKQRTDVPFRPRIESVSGCAATIEPNTGLLPAVITIAGNPEIRLSVTYERGAVELEAKVVQALGGTLPFSIDRLKRYRTRILQEQRDVASQLISVRREIAALRAWLEAPQVKALATRGRVRTRLQALERMDGDASTVQQALAAEFASNEQLIRLAESIDGVCTLNLVEEPIINPDERGKRATHMLAGGQWNCCNNERTEWDSAGVRE